MVSDWLLWYQFEENWKFTNNESNKQMKGDMVSGAFFVLPWISMAVTLLK